MTKLSHALGLSLDSRPVTGLNKQSTHARFNNLILNLKAQPPEMFALLATLRCNQNHLRQACAEQSESPKTPRLKSSIVLQQLREQFVITYLI